MITREEGLDFENNIHKILEKTNYQLYNEKEIIKKYGRITFGIDHLLFVNDCIIGFQDKWKNKNNTNKDINHFINALNIIVIIEKKNCFGIYLSKKPLTCIAQDIFNFLSINTENKYFSIFKENQEDLFQELKLILHTNKLYLYDDDGSSIMLEGK